MTLVGGTGYSLGPPTIIFIRGLPGAFYHQHGGLVFDHLLVPLVIGLILIRKQEPVRVFGGF